MTYEKFEQWTHPAKMSPTEVEVKLPRFKLEATYDLNEALRSLGMVDVFDVTKSNLSGDGDNYYEITALLYIARYLFRILSVLCHQACLQQTTWSCQKLSTRLS